MKHKLLFKNILLVDDDQDDCFIFGEALSEIDKSIRFSCLTSTERLMAALQQNKPDLIFLDINMPKKNGFDCLQEIKSAVAFKAIPVVMYSNSTRPQEVDDAYMYGASLYIKKPSNHKILVQMLRTLVEEGLPKAKSGTYLYNGTYYTVNSQLS